MKLLTLIVSLLAMGPGVYTNPILHSDYSDPDVIRVGEDFWMTSSSFNCVPGLQILHSTDLVNWEIVGAALREGPEACWELFGSEGAAEGAAVQHGNGVWAPCIRYHNGTYYIFWGDPDYGIFQVHTQDPRGEWSKPVLVLAGKGMIDTSPLWDDDGKVYLVHGWAGSRNGFKSMLSVCELNRDCSGVISEQVLVFDGNKNGNSTVEGPKFYKRNGWYYIFAPSGGVKTGWQLVLRSRNVYGPYEFRTVLHQGDTDIHGPHQGGWVTDTNGKDWFLHFEDRYAYGRVVHMQPLTWLKDDWCIIGVDSNKDGIGEPVLEYEAPYASKSSNNSSADASEEAKNFGGASSEASATADRTEKTYVSALATETDFTTAKVPLNWQWQAKPEVNWLMTDPSDGCLRLNCIKKGDGWKSLWDTPNMLLEKVVGEEMTFTSKFIFRPSYAGDRTGLVVMGRSYSSIDLCYDGKLVSIVRHNGINANSGEAETTGESMEIHRVKKEAGPFYTIYFRVKIEKGCICTFHYSYDGKKFTQLGDPFTGREGEWIGAKLGFYSIADIKKNDGGYVEVY